MQISDIVPLDLSVYLRAPVFSVQEGVSLARALLAIVPRGVPALVTRAADKLRRAADAAEAGLLERQRELSQLTEEDGRLIDQEMDAAWGGLRLRLQGYAALPSARVPSAARAAALLTQLFGDQGLSFLKESYSAQLTSMTTLLQRIAQDKLGTDLDALCGPEFLAEIRHLLPRYERMVQAMLSRPLGSGQNLVLHRAALGRAVVAYATAICATVDDEVPKTVQAALAALSPLDGQRAAAADRRQPGAGPKDPPPPAPPAPAPAAG